MCVCADQEWWHTVNFYGTWSSFYSFPLLFLIRKDLRGTAPTPLVQTFLSILATSKVHSILKPEVLRRKCWNTGRLRSEVDPILLPNHFSGIKRHLFWLKVYRKAPTRHPRRLCELSHEVKASEHPLRAADHYYIPPLIPPRQGGYSPRRGRWQQR